MAFELYGGTIPDSARSFALVSAMTLVCHSFHFVHFPCHSHGLNVGHCLCSRHCSIPSLGLVHWSCFLFCLSHCLGLDLSLDYTVGRATNSRFWASPSPSSAFTLVLEPHQRKRMRSETGKGPARHRGSPGRLAMGRLPREPISEGQIETRTCCPLCLKDPGTSSRVPTPHYAKLAVPITGAGDRGTSQSRDTARLQGSGRCPGRPVGGPSRRTRAAPAPGALTCCCAGRCGAGTRSGWP